MDGLGVLLLPLIIIAVYLVLMVPQRRAAQRHRELVAGLRNGDDVVTMGGIYGTVTEVEDGETLLLEIAEDTDIRVARASIARVVTPGPAAEDAADAPGSSSDTLAE